MDKDLYDLPPDGSPAPQVPASLEALAWRPTRLPEGGRRVHQRPIDT
jgi:hypothetical protein